MTNTHHMLTGTIKGAGGHSLLKRALARVSALSEYFWFCLSFLLFIIMGPFSAIAVVIGLCSLASEENRNRMIEPEGI
ncbi:MAG TPA: hypothetical protein ENI89_06105 [Desulfobulbus sp.]|nr:hypothetical protein [Desulfobulbus sp.]